ncbi:hypothetical protein HNQ56_001743 [Anaerotaenia torta]|uniref:hypothetical protein n=1 Tax=Anaerotaenia torta TaxID=433293 RepID=UPI003D1E495F
MRNGPKSRRQRESNRIEGIPERGRGYWPRPCFAEGRAYAGAYRGLSRESSRTAADAEMERWLKERKGINEGGTGSMPTLSWRFAR